MRTLGSRIVASLIEIQSPGALEDLCSSAVRRLQQAARVVQRVEVAAGGIVKRPNVAIRREHRADLLLRHVTNAAVVIALAQRGELGPDLQLVSGLDGGVHVSGSPVAAIRIFLGQLADQSQPFDGDVPYGSGAFACRSAARASPAPRQLPEWPARRCVQRRPSRFDALPTEPRGSRARRDEARWSTLRCRRRRRKHRNSRSRAAWAGLEPGGRTPASTSLAGAGR